MAKRFPAAVAEDEINNLDEEVMDHILAPSSTLPSLSTEEMGKLKKINGTPRFLLLTKLAKCLLSLPYSNADTERVFSMVRKITTEYCSEMEQNTLCALVACKLNDDSSCFELDTPKELLARAPWSTL